MLAAFESRPPKQLITWNLNGRRSRSQQQNEALAARGPGIVALQEVTAHSLPELRTALIARGLVHILDGFATVPLTDRPRKYRQLVASRFPVQLPQELNSSQSACSAAAEVSYEGLDGAATAGDWVASSEID